jgi:endo-1,3-1,4-beta-glycanase ExoK
MGKTWKKSVAAALLAGVAAAAVGAFQLVDGSPSPPVERPLGPVLNTGRPPADGFLVQMGSGYDPATQWLADYTMYADWLSTGYDPANVRFAGGRMVMSIEKRPIQKQPYAGAEFQRLGFYGYGRYEVVMRASGKAGVVSSFFTHTDDYYKDPHDEIDFEFLGKNRREVQLNYFTNNQAGGPFIIRLPFDASKKEHLYAFEWSREAIRWYIDGRLVQEVLAATARVPLPQTSQRVIANIWTGAGPALGWTGVPKFRSTSASYSCMSHVPIGRSGSQCSDTYKPPKRQVWR